MIAKKNLTIISTAIFVFFTSSSAFARYSTNDGNYLQLDAIRMMNSNRTIVSEEYKTYDIANNGASYQDGVKYYFTGIKPGGSATGFGLSYRYAYSFEKILIDPLKWIFIAPGIFYENVNDSNLQQVDSTFSTSVSYKNRRGVKVDLGYDFDYGIAPYITGGFSGIDYKVTTTESSIPSSLKKSGTSYAPFYGAGIYYSPFEKVSFMLEYVQQSNSINYHFSDTYQTTGVPFNKVESTLRIVKFGVAYHF